MKILWLLMTSIAITSFLYGAELDTIVESAIYIVRKELQKDHERYIQYLTEGDRSDSSLKLGMLTKVDTLEKYEEYIRSTNQGFLLQLSDAEVKIVKYFCKNIPDPLEILLSVCSVVDYFDMHPLSCKKMFTMCFDTFAEYDLKDSYNDKILLPVMSTVAVSLSSYFKNHQHRDSLRRQGIHTIGSYKDFLRRNPYVDSKKVDVDDFSTIVTCDTDYLQAEHKHPLRLPLPVQKRIEDYVSKSISSQDEVVSVLGVFKEFGYIHPSIVDNMIVNVSQNLSALHKR